MTEWNLKEIYINDEAWSKDLEILKNKINEVSKFKCHLKTEQEINDLEAYIKDQVKKLIEEVKRTDLYFVMVTNEIGLGVVPSYKLGRVYCDFVGRINQMLGRLSDEVYFTVCGIPTKIKG